MGLMTAPPTHKMAQIGSFPLFHFSIARPDVEKFSDKPKSTMSNTKVLSQIQTVRGRAALRPYPEYSRANSYPWSPFHPRRARPGPGPHKVGGWQAHGERQQGRLLDKTDREVQPGPWTGNGQGWRGLGCGTLGGGGSGFVGNPVEGGPAHVGGPTRAMKLLFDYLLIFIVFCNKNHSTFALLLLVCARCEVILLAMKDWVWVGLLPR